MANDMKLRIQAEEAEMERYRAGLARRFQKTQPIRRWKPVILAAAAAVLVFVLVPGIGTNEFENLELANLQLMAQGASPDMKDRARELLHGEPSFARSNARMFLCMAEDAESGIRMAAQGVQEDPRPDFRFYYLEFLLDEADEYSLDASRIESLMETEADRDCLDLYKSLLRLAT